MHGMGGSNVQKKNLGWTLLPHYVGIWLERNNKIFKYTFIPPDAYSHSDIIYVIYWANLLLEWERFKL